MGAKTKLAGYALAISAALVGVFEGTRYVTYLDPLGIPTVCEGHTGPDVKLGQKYTKQQCAEFTARDIQTAWDTIERCYPTASALPEPTQAAWTSFTLNVGPGGKGVKDGFCRLKSGGEPTLLRKLKAGDLRGACAELPKWDNPKSLPGIAKRRAVEFQYCVKELP